MTVLAEVGILHNKKRRFNRSGKHESDRRAALLNDESILDKQQPQPEPYSVVVEGLTGAQGTLAVIAALLASLAFGGLTAVTEEDCSRAHWLTVSCYYLVTAAGVAGQLFVCVVCTLMENHGKVARGLAQARSGRDR